jgi:hypothetical protein
MSRVMTNGLRFLKLFPQTSLLYSLSNRVAKLVLVEKILHYASPNLVTQSHDNTIRIQPKYLAGLCSHQGTMYFLFPILFQSIR